MKKKITMSLAILLTVFCAFGQDSLTVQDTRATRPFVEFRGRTTISAFAGGYAAQQNGYNHGSWYGLYMEYLPARFLFSEYKHLNLGFCALASKNVYNGNDKISRYSSANSEFGAGLAGGLFSYNFSRYSALYLGASAMIKDLQEIGEGTNNGSIGRYLVKEENLMFSTELNINVMKTYESGRRDWPRTQLRLIYQMPLETERDAFWNATPLPGTTVWDKTAYMGELKVSLYRFGKSPFFEPKLVTAYHYYEGDKSNWIIGGLELALKKLNWDDFLSLQFLVKKQIGNFEPNLNSTLYVLQINFSPLNLTRF